MKFYSTNNKAHQVSLRDAVIQGLAPDNGLYMPEAIAPLPKSFFDNIAAMSFQDMAYAVVDNLLHGDVPEAELRRIVEHTLQFDAPLVPVEDQVYALELFHGPTMAFKDFGARFMSQLLGYFARQQDREVTILVATSGDTGSAVANGFLGVPGTRVIVLYPSGKVSDVQEKQFTTLGQNITALEIDGTFDDCQRLVKQAFLDEDLRKKHFLTSANSINIARLIPQSFYYFYAYSRLPDRNSPVVFSVSSGNFGNLTGGLLAQRMGLPVDRFIASTNINDSVPVYLQTAQFNPHPSRQTISNAMDVGNPSNFARLQDMFGGSHDALAQAIEGHVFTDPQTEEAMQSVYKASGYVLDPHGAVGYLGLKKHLQQRKDRVNGIFLETAHPGKFLEVVESVLGTRVPLPSTLQKFMTGKKQTVRMPNDFQAFKTFLGV
jgi:threonine synthase